MPTGYTYKVMDGSITELNQFVLQCARAFGALVHMRDDDMDAPIRLAQTSDYYKKMLDEAKAELDAIIAVTDPAKQADLGRERVQRDLKRAREFLKEQEEENARNHRMQTLVSEYEAPPNWLKLKGFMREQLSISLHSDRALTLQRESIVEMERVLNDETKMIETYHQLIKDAQRDVNYYEKELQKDYSRAEERNAMIIELFESLGMEPSK